MANLRLAIFGCGFWARFQIAAWLELPGVQIVALYNRTRARAEELANLFAIPAVYDDPEELLRIEQIDAIDVITGVETHAQFVSLAARHGIPVICQKPMATTFAEAEQMVQQCAAAGTPLFIHENWRWQRPLRHLKHLLDAGHIGSPFRGRIQFSSSFPVFTNQPFLKELEQFILTDIGSHILDTARFLFGDAQRLYCQTSRVNQEIKGEDVATVMLQQGEVTCICEMSYGSRLEHERFPETYVLIEGTKGSLELGPDYWLRCTTDAGTHARRYPPHHYSWADPAYDLVHASIVDCNANMLQALSGRTVAETNGADNLKTMQLVFSSCRSSASNQAIFVQ